MEVHDRLPADDIKALVSGLQDITATLAADPADKAKVYAREPHATAPRISY